MELGGRWEQPSTSEKLTSVGKDALLLSSFVPVVGGVTKGATVGKFGTEAGKEIVKRLTASQAKNFGAQVGVELAADVGLQAVDRGAGGGSFAPTWRDVGANLPEAFTEGLVETAIPGYGGKSKFKKVSSQLGTSTVSGSLAEGIAPDFVDDTEGPSWIGNKLAENPGVAKYVPQNEFIMGGASGLLSGAVLTPTGGALRAAGNNVTQLHLPHLPTTPGGLTVVQAVDQVKHAAVDQTLAMVDRLRVQGPGSLSGSNMTNAQVREFERIMKGRYWNPDQGWSTNVRDPYTLSPAQSAAAPLTGSPASYSIIQPSAPQSPWTVTDTRPDTSSDAAAGVAARDGLDASRPGSTAADPAKAPETVAVAPNEQPADVNNIIDTGSRGPASVGALTYAQVRELNRALAVRQHLGGRSYDGTTAPAADTAPAVDAPAAPAVDPGGTTQEVRPDAVAPSPEVTPSPVTEASSQAAQQAAGVSQDVTRDLTTDVTQDLARGLNQDLTQDVTKYLTQDATRDVTTDVTRDVTKDITTDVTKDITTDVTKDITTDVTKDITTDVTKDDITTDVTKDDITTDVTKDDITTDVTKDDITTDVTKDDITQETTREVTADVTTAVNPDATTATLDPTPTPRLAVETAEQPDQSNDIEAQGPPDGFPRRIAHNETVRYSYDPATDKVTAELVSVQDQPDILMRDATPPDGRARSVASLIVTPVGRQLTVDQATNRRPQRSPTTSLPAYAGRPRPPQARRCPSTPPLATSTTWTPTTPRPSTPTRTPRRPRLQAHPRPASGSAPWLT